MYTLTIQLMCMNLSATKMYYSRAVKGSLTRSGAAREIASQAEVELGRRLTNEEELNLFQRFSPQAIIDRIEKVNKKNVNDGDLQI